MDNNHHLIGVISDTHGLLRPAVGKAFAGVELILHAGDVGKQEVLEELRKLAPVVAVRGNTDHGGWAQKLPLQEIVEVAETVIYLVHDLNALDLNPAAAGFHVVVSGHSHDPYVVRKNGVLYLNPGSAGPRRFSLPISLALLKIDCGRLKVELIDLEGIN